MDSYEAVYHDTKLDEISEEIEVKLHFGYQKEV